MDERNDRLYVALVPELERDAREGIDEAPAYWAAAQVSWDSSTSGEKPVDIRLHDHASPAGRTDLSIVDSMIGINLRSEGIFVLFQDLEDLGLVHSLEQHSSTVYGGVDVLSN
jgi:hypothetical protein